jgi:hypothetical protein
MSALGDALAALKNVVLMQERIDVMRTEQVRISDDVRGLNDYVQAVDKRVIRIETMIEMSGRAGGSPRLEG